MFMPAWTIRLAPYLGGLLLAVAAYAWAYGRGVDAERAKWQAVQAKAAEVQRQREVVLQAQVDAAGVALSERAVVVERIREKAQILTRNYYVQNPAFNVPCLDSSRLRHISDSDTAATAAGTAK
jgi:hypothetical protein